MGRVFKDLDFAKAARRARLSDATLLQAVGEADAGLVDAVLGGEVIKKRVARDGAGKRGGYRTIIAFRREDRAFFVHLFAKNDEANVPKEDLRDLRIYARTLMGLDDAGLRLALDSGDLLEIEYGKSVSE